MTKADKNKNTETVAEDKQTTPQPSLEESFVGLDGIISSLENGQLSLDESFRLYNEGIELIKNCNAQLDKTEKQIIILNKNGEEDEL